MGIAGAETDGTSANPSITPDGRFVAFGSDASNLVAGDTNGVQDIFVLTLATGALERVSMSYTGGEPDDSCAVPKISANGRFVCFQSNATNLVPGDTNAVMDIFVHDRMTALTVRVNLDSSGGQSGLYSSGPVISSDGRFVAFSSFADDLVPGDTNQNSDVFLRDLQAGTTERISVDGLGMELDGNSSGPSLSSDARFVAFYSESANLVPGDTNGYGDVFVRDRLSGTNERISVTASGVEGNHHSRSAQISADGQMVVFITLADNFWWSDSNFNQDVFVVDRLTRTMDLVSVNPDGDISSGTSYECIISADGRYVVFRSDGDNLVPGDSNDASDVFVRNLRTMMMERVSVDSNGVESNSGGSQVTTSGDGGIVVFSSRADNLVPFDTNNRGDIFLHDRWDGEGANAVFLTGPSTVQVGTPFYFSWQATRPFADTWFFASLSRGGSSIGGHRMDIGSHAKILASGLTNIEGMGFYSAPPVPAAASGSLMFFEVLLVDGQGLFLDSNVVDVLFQ